VSNMKNLKNCNIWITTCCVCDKPIFLGEDMCSQNLEITKEGTTTIAIVFFHPECAGEYYRRFPDKKEGAE